MKKILTVILLASCCSLLRPNPVHSQLVKLYTDSLATLVFANCDLFDAPPGQRTVYVVLHGYATAVRFRLEASPGMRMAYVSETHYASVLEGDTQVGIAFCMGSQQTDPVLLAAVRYDANGTSDECSEIVIAPYPGSNTIDAILSPGTYGWYAAGSRLTVNPSIYCQPCDDQIYYGPPTNPDDFCQPVSNDVTTWGRMKVLYQ